LVAIGRCGAAPSRGAHDSRVHLHRRTEALRKQVIASGGLRASELYFIGHSTGGLDVRMLLTPDVKIARGDTTTW